MKKTAAITGASGGIGFCAAKRFADAGYEVYNLSRRECRLPGVKNIATDVTDESSVEAAFEKIKSESGGLDILVCNAGFGIAGAIEFTPLREAKSQFDVNFFGAFCCIKAALPLLKMRGGRIICTSSAAAVFAIPFQSFYSASKAAINIMIKALRNEIRQFGVSACAVQLGDVKTGFTGARHKDFEGDDIYGGIISESVSVMERDEQNGMSPKAVSKAIYSISQKKHLRVLYTVGWRYKVFCALQKILPEGSVNYIVGKMYIPKR